MIVSAMIAALGLVAILRLPGGEKTARSIAL